MQLSSVKEMGVVQIAGRRGIVVNRCPEDRSSGITDVQWGDGHREQFIWDYNNPKVKYLGQGKVILQITLDS